MASFSFHLALAGLVGSWVLYNAAKAVYNLYFHPLRNIPGPKSWIVFPILRQIAAARGLYDKYMLEFHEYYGDAVRTNPQEVSFNTAQAWRDIYGHRPRPLPKYIALDEPGRAASILTAGEIDHARFRKSISFAFSDKALRSQEHLVKSYVDLLVKKLGGVAISGESTDMFKWYNLTTFDVIGDLTFGESFKGLETNKLHGWITMLFGAVKIAPFVRLAQKIKNYPVIKMLLPLVIPKDLAAQRIGHRVFTKEAVEKRVNNTAQHGRGDFMDGMLKHKGEKDEINDEELRTNAEVLVVAGSETMATLLSGVTYWLLQTPHAMERVTAEVRDAFENDNQLDFVSVTAKLPYMRACLNEAMRIYPPVPTSLRRITQDPITDISGYAIPAGCYVSVHHLSAYHSARRFHQPLTFAPERWLPDAPEQFANDDRAAFQPFNVGPRNCIGKNLAYNEVTLVLARVLWNYDLELCEESLQWNRQKSFTLWEKPPLMCKLREKL